MAVTFRKSIRIFPGVRLNLGRHSVSVTVRVGPLSRTYSTSGRTTTSADLPGPFGYRRTRSRRRTRI